MPATIRPRRLKARNRLFVVGDLQGASCQRRVRGVLDEAFQTRSAVATDAGGRMAEVDKGGVVFMSECTPHRSTPDVTDWDVRWSLDLRYQQTGTPTGRLSSRLLRAQPVRSR